MTQLLTTVIQPLESAWLKVFTSGMLLNLLFSFSFRTFHALYEVDLWSALVGQRFEFKVESWADINWFSQFIYLENFVFTDIGQNLLKIYVMDAIYLQNGKDIEIPKTAQAIIPHMNKAQISPEPSDVIFFTTKNEYISIGLEMQRLQIPYKLRISRRPIESFDEKNGLQFWSLLRHSLLTEPISRAKMKIDVGTN